MEGGKLNILNRFFSSSNLHALLNEENPRILYIIQERHLYASKKIKSKLNFVQSVYQILQSDYRNEYFYKNTLLNRLLLGVHSIRTTTALRELPIGRAKADFVLINGKAVVYEIKTELDNLERLDGQLANYYKAFDHVVVVTSEKHEKNILKYVPSKVGVYLLTKKGTFKHLREPIEDTTHIESEVLFKILRKNEYEKIIKSHYGQLPQVNQFSYYRTCKDLFANIPLSEAYSMVLKVLKERILINKECFEQVPYELKFLVYFSEFKKKDYSRLFDFLNSEFRRK